MSFTARHTRAGTRGSGLGRGWGASGAVLAVALGVAGSLGSVGCAATCERIDRSQREHLTGIAKASTTAPHLRLTLPKAVVSQLWRTALGKVARYQVELPEIAGLDLGSASLSVSKIELVDAAPGKIGLALELDLAMNRRALTRATARIETTPKVNAAEGTLELSLSPNDLRALDVKLGPKGAEGLVNALWDELPDVAKMVLSKQQLTRAVQEASGPLMREITDTIREQAGASLGEVVSFEIDLDPLPVRDVKASTSREALVLDVWTTLPVDAGLAPEPNGVGSGVSAGSSGGAQVTTPRATLHLAGATAAALANDAMKRGEIPSRFGLDGEPSPTGAIEADVAWAEGEARPLRVNLWCTKDECFHAVLGATPSFAVRGDELELSTNDAKIVKVKGSARVKAGVWFSGLGRETFTFVETIARKFEFDVAGTPMVVSLDQARRNGDELELELGLKPGRPAAAKRPTGAGTGSSGSTGGATRPRSR